MTPIEDDVVRINRRVTAEVIGERRTVSIPGETEGVVVLVYGELQAYEVEFYVVDQNCYALATLAANLLD
jgi:hypothetical protein